MIKRYLAYRARWRQARAATGEILSDVRPEREKLFGGFCVRTTRLEHWETEDGGEAGVLKMRYQLLGCLGLAEVQVAAVRKRGDDRPTLVRFPSRFQCPAQAEPKEAVTLTELLPELMSMGFEEAQRLGAGVPKEQKPIFQTMLTRLEEGVDI